MTVLAAAQQAIMKLVGQKPAAVVSSTDTICVEMTALAQEAAVEIAKDNDWQKLISFGEIMADGMSEAYDLPADYDRMVQASDLYDPSNWFWGYRHVSDLNEWMALKVSGYAFIQPGVWTMYGGQFHFMPTPEAGRKAQFAYVKNTIFLSQAMQPKAAITSDNDSFVLGDRLLTLALIWKWLSLKRMDYQQEMDDYNLAISQEETRDKGARVIRKGSRHRPFNASIAWPWSLG
ncbi:MAG: phage adaptor protein [Rhizobiaceae bacterium]